MRAAKGKSIAFLLAMMMLTALLAGCGTGTDKAENISGDQAGMKLGIMAGSMFDSVAREYYPEAEICLYNSNIDLAEALKSGAIDAYMLDEPVARLTLQSFPDQSVSSMIEPASYAFAFAGDSERSDRLCEQMNDFIEASRKNGVLQELDDIWFGTEEERKTVSFDGLTGENGTLRIASTSDLGGPFVYLKDGAWKGYEIDLLTRFCREYGYAPEITDYNFSALLTAVSSGKDDIAAGTLIITEDRQKLVNFSVPFYDGGVVSVTKKEQTGIPDDLTGKRLGVVTGGMFDGVARKYYPEAELRYYDTFLDLADALDAGIIDAYMIDEPIGRTILRPYTTQSISSVIEPASFAFAFTKDDIRSDVLREQVNDFIEKSRQNGNLQELDDIWFGTDEERKTIPFDQLTDKNGTIRLAISTDVGEPFAYLKNGALAGYDIDLLVRFCLEYGYALDVKNYSFADMLTSVADGTNDIAACAITVTEERQKTLDFSIPTYTGGVVIVTKSTPEYTLESFSGKKIGVLTGSIYDAILSEHIPDAQPVYVNANADLFVAMDSGKIDAYVLDQPISRLVRRQYPDQEPVLQLEDAAYAFMFPKNSAKHAEICRQFNEFLAQSWVDGTMDEIDSIWFGSDEERQDVDMSDLTGENGVLELAVSSACGEPFSYVKNGHMVGYDIDTAVRFCRAYGYGLHISDYNIAGLLAATSTGKADMAACSIAITPERQENALMSDPNYIGGIMIVTRIEQAGTEQVPLWVSLRESFERTFLRENRWKMFMSGIGVTLMITVISAIAGTVLGFLAYLLYRQGWKAFNGVWYVVTSIMGKTPVVVILMILYYILFRRSNLSGAGVSIIGFTVLFTCTVADLLKMGAGAVDRGQTEAGLALGYSDWQIYRKIIFPQSIEHFLPAYKNEVITLVKATAVVGYIAVQDITKIGDMIRARTYEAFFPLLATAVIYFVMAVVLARLICRINVLTDPYRRDQKKILRGVKME